MMIQIKSKKNVGSHLTSFTCTRPPEIKSLLQTLFLTEIHQIIGNFKTSNDGLMSKLMLLEKLKVGKADKIFSVVV